MVADFGRAKLESPGADAGFSVEVCVEVEVLSGAEAVRVFSSPSLVVPRAAEGTASPRQCTTAAARALRQVFSDAISVTTPYDDLRPTMCKSAAVLDWVGLLGDARRGRGPPST